MIDRVPARSDALHELESSQGDSSPPQRERRPDYRRYWLALFRRDVAGAERIVDQALEVWKPDRIYLRLFQPALALSGKLWAAGSIHYHDEHFVTHHTIRLMRRVRHRWLPKETSGPLALVTGAGQESHMIGLRMVCDFLRAANWRIRWLSSNDRGAVRQAVATIRPNAFMISIGLDEGLTPAARLIQEVREHHYQGLIVVGGAAINRDPARVRALGAQLTAVNGRHLVRLLRPWFPHERAPIP
jgi:methanogenic corrinoid protein MtbC1